MKTYIWTSFIVLLAFLVGCSSENDLIEQNPDEYFIISLKEESSLSTRASDDKAFLKEIDFVQLFFFEGDDLVWVPQPQQLKYKDDKVYISINDENVLGRTYDLYVLANRSIDDLSSISNLTEFKAQLLKEELKGDVPYLLMNGELPNVSLDLSQPKLGTVKMKRVPAQVKVKIKFDSTKFTTEECSTNSEYQIKKLTLNLHHYNTSAYYWNDERVSGSLSDLAQWNNVTLAFNKEEELYQNLLPIYSYPNSWENNSERETYLVLAVDMVKCGGNGSEVTYYYQIPIDGFKDGKWVSNSSLVSNKLYVLNLSINEIGNTDSNTPLPLKGEVAVMEWNEEDIGTSIDDLNYLFVNPLISQMFDKRIQLLDYDSSKPEVSQKDLKVYANYYNVDGELVNGIYTGVGGTGEFVDKDQYPVISFLSSEKQIKVELSPSKNNLEKHIDFTVTNGIPELDQKVEILQVPDISIITYRATSAGLDIVIPIPGLGWSSAKSHSVYNFKINVPKGQIVKYPPKVEKNTILGKFMITSDTQEVQNMISPSFMTGSIRSTVANTGSLIQDNWQLYHCRWYYEKAIVNGTEITYEDFRLPTRAELELMVDREYNNSILFKRNNLFTEGELFWAADGKYKYSMGKITKVSRGSAYVVCVRDVK